MKILFLTNNKNSMPLVDWLENNAHEDVVLWDSKLTKENILRDNPELIISYNYRYIIKKEIIDLFPDRIINLHISFLPWNKGAHPNMWSFLEDTPKGVTIHLIDEGLDTGKILIQKRVRINEAEHTLNSSYELLHKQIQDLFKINWHEIKRGKIKPKTQDAKGTNHSMKDFDKIKHILWKDGWNIPISKLKAHYKISQNNK